MIQKVKYLFLCFLLLIGREYSFSQNLSDAKKLEYYKRAYAEICDMLSGKKILNLKRAIFITENAYLGGEMDYISYDN